jgi:transcriptional regulator with XRE-family HTH domain
VATHIGVYKSASSKIEKGLRALTVDELQKMAQLFNMTTDQVINHDGKVPKEVIIEDKTAVEQMRLIQQLDEDESKSFLNSLTKYLPIRSLRTSFRIMLLPYKQQSPAFCQTCLNVF